MPSSLVSSWIAVTNSLVPATLKSMSPKASSAPRMSVSATYSRLAVDGVGDQAHRDAGDRRRSGTPALSSDRVRGADRAHRRRAVGAERLGHLTDRVGELLARRQHRQQRPLGERAVADLAALRASPPGRSHRWSTAGSCSCACSACGSPATSVSSCCSIRSMFSVVTPRIWVSPRSNSAEPCTRGSDLDLGARAGGCRPGRGRRCGPCRAGCAGGRASSAPSGTPRRSPSRGPRTASARRGLDDESLISSISASRAPACRRWSAPARRSARHGGLDGLRRRRPGSRGRAGTRRSAWPRAPASCCCARAERGDERLGRLEALGDDLLGRAPGALGLDEVPGRRRWPRPRPS